MKLEILQSLMAPEILSLIMTALNTSDVPVVKGVKQDFMSSGSWDSSSLPVLLSVLCLGEMWNFPVCNQLTYKIVSNLQQGDFAAPNSFPL